MKVKIESDRHGHGRVYLDGKLANNVRSLRLDLGIEKINTVTLEYIADTVEFEGNAEVVAIIDGRKYKMIKDDQ